ncbi:dihydrodipicolinate reductase [candidate division KSB1 bacterium]|nr:dihydrodipicolinate reductase [candidate division KSB1 bacterium]
MENQLKIVQYGLGPIGIEAAKLVLQKKRLKLVGGIDIDPDKVGVDLGDVLGLDSKLKISVSNDPQKVLNETQPDIVLHSTGSFLAKVEEQLQICLQAGASVVSSCEELFYPYRRDAKFCARIDKVAEENKTTVVGTGVNPGFSMDVLVLAMSGVCTKIEKIVATRVVDASKRRLPLQKKVGAGLTPDEFRNLVRQGKLGHIGLVESLYAVADKIGFQFDELKETIDPQISTKTIETDYLTVQQGEVAGILHVAKALKKDEELIKLELQMFVGAEKERDSVTIEGEPPIHLNVEGGIFGDKATIARMINAIPVVSNASPGLTTVVDLPLATYFK